MRSQNIISVHVEIWFPQNRKAYDTSTLWPNQLNVLALQWQNPWYWYLTRKKVYCEIKTENNFSPVLHLNDHETFRFRFIVLRKIRKMLTIQRHLTATSNLNCYCHCFLPVSSFIRVLLSSFRTRLSIFFMKVAQL